MTSTPTARPAVHRPPTKHELALMIWLAVFPTLTVLNLALGEWLSTLGPVLRTSTASCHSCTGCAPAW
jgi:antibiotic biosynthesis monooxygenase (ABM) superfamily enzyme